MNFHGKDIKIFACNSNLPVAKQMAERLGLKLGQADVKHFSDGEIAVSINESVRGSVYLSSMSKKTSQMSLTLMVIETPDHSNIS